MARIDEESGELLGKAIAAPGMILFIEAAILHNLFRVSWCKQGHFGLTCEVYQGLWQSLLGDNPMMILVVSTLAFCVVYTLLCRAWRTMNIMLGALAVYAYLGWWWPAGGLNDHNFWPFLIFGGFGAAIIIADHVNALQKQRTAAR